MSTQRTKFTSIHCCLIWNTVSVYAPNLVLFWTLSSRWNDTNWSLAIQQNESKCTTKAKLLLYLSIWFYYSCVTIFNLLYKFYECSAGKDSCSACTAKKVWWLPWLQSSWRDSGYEKLILVLEANCISNLAPNHTLQRTTHRTSVRELLPSHFTKMMLLTKAGDSLTDVQWSQYLHNLGCCCTDVHWLL